MAMDAERLPGDVTRRGRLQRGQEPSRQRAGGLPGVEGAPAAPASGSGPRGEEKLQRPVQERHLQEQEEEAAAAAVEHNRGLGQMLQRAEAAQL